MKLASLVGMVCLLTSAAPVLKDPTGSPDFVFPVIQNHGAIVALPEAAQQPRKGSRILLDVISDKKAGGVVLGLDRAALILNQYAQAGASDFRLAVVLHGPATVAALSHEGFAAHADPYQKATGHTKNPNLDLITKLTEAGAEVYVCGQALAHHKFATTEVAPAVKVAVSAATVNINLQTDGYAYILFP